MAHFFGTVTGSNSMTSRCGTKASGISSMIQGEEVGVFVIGKSIDGQDTFSVFMTKGRKYKKGSRFIGNIIISPEKEVTFEPVCLEVKKSE